jgi:hypothetical protein
LLANFIYLSNWFYENKFIQFKAIFESSSVSRWNPRAYNQYVLKASKTVIQATDEKETPRDPPIHLSLATFTIDLGTLSLS